MPHHLQSPVDQRPWNGPCATTGHTMDEFAEYLGDQDQHGNPWDPRVTRSAVSICRRYGIRGICDPAYIANVITNELAELDRSRL
jgi:hypothetical protein